MKTNRRVGTRAGPTKGYSNIHAKSSPTASSAIVSLRDDVAIAEFSMLELLVDTVFGFEMKAFSAFNVWF